MHRWARRWMGHRPGYPGQWFRVRFRLAVRCPNGAGEASGDRGRTLFEKLEERARGGSPRFDHRKVATARIGFEARVRQIVRQSLAIVERGDPVFFAPEQEGRRLDRVEALVDRRKVHAAHRGESGRAGPRATELIFHGLDKRLGDKALVEEREHHSFVGALVVIEREQRLPDPSGIGPLEEGVALLFVDIGIVERDSFDSFRRVESEGQGHRGSPGVRDDRRPFDAQPVEHFEDEPRLRHRRVVSLGAIGPPEALEVESDHSVLLLEAGSNTRPHVHR
ncbi:MAG: hypothetical protein AAGF12_12225 [Myxococcota bacterium]